MVLLTGSNGFLGKQIENKLRSSLLPYETLNRSKGDYMIDLSLDVPQFLKSYDLIIHSAGTAHYVPKSVSQGQLLYDSNVKGLLNLLLALKNYKLPKEFIFISSVSVYGVTSGFNINETAQLDAQDPYGKSKIECEKILTKWCEDNNIILTVLRLPLIIGFNAPGNLGSRLKAIKYGYYFNVGKS